jgi:hypothetical protein
MPILRMAAKMDDSEIKEELKKVDRKSTRVGIGYITEMENPWRREEHLRAVWRKGTEARCYSEFDVGIST